MIKNLAFISLFTICCFNGVSQTPVYCSSIFNGSIPYNIDDSVNQIVIRESYALSTNPNTKFVDWVCYKVTNESSEGSDKTRTWRPDPWLPDKSTLEPSPDDYYGAHESFKYDRGHMAPLASFDGLDTWYEVNYYSNITPQMENLNRGPWVKLENAERELLKEYDAIYVICGTLYEADFPPLPNADEPHIIPSHFWKVIICEKGSKVKIASYLFPQSVSRSDSFFDYWASIDEIEERSGFNVIWNLSEGLNVQLEDDQWLHSIIN
jgi:endonuclease G, mitochondrial